MKNFKKIIWPFYRFLILTFKIKLDFHDIIEFFKIVSLSKGNYLFYKNVFSIIPSNNLIILDVGANDGWFSKVVYRFRKDLKIIAFEPLASMYEDLVRIKKLNKKFDFYNCAVGSEIGKVEISEYGTEGLSSLKDLSDEYQYNDHFNTSIKEKYEVKIIKLDDFILENKITNDLCLKIDTQGYEMEVLLGAQNTLKLGQIKFIIIELMTVEKYKEAKLYHEIINFLSEFDFQLVDIHQSYYEDNGEMSEFDALFKLKKIKK